MEFRKTGKLQASALQFHQAIGSKAAIEQKATQRRLKYGKGAASSDTSVPELTTAAPKHVAKSRRFIETPSIEVRGQAALSP